MLVPNWPRVQIVARVILRRQLTGDLGVGKKLVEVSNRIEGSRVADEVIDLLSARLSVSDTKQ